jgi:WD40 repeat protein
MESWTRWKSGEQQRPYYARLADPSKAPSGCGSSVTSLAFLAGDSSLLAAGCPDGKIILFDIAAPKFGEAADFKYSLRSTSLTGAIGSVSSLSFDSDRQLLYAGGNTSKIEVWRIPTVAQDKKLVAVRRDLENLIAAAANASDIKSLDEKIDGSIRDVCRTSEELSGSDACKLR